MTRGPEAPTGRDVQGSGGRRNPAGSGRSRSWPTPILCHDLSFFFRGGEEPHCVHQWASSCGQAQAAGRLITLRSSILFQEIITRNCYIDDTEHERTPPRGSSLPCMTRTLVTRPPCVSPGTSRPPLSPTTVIGHQEEAREPITDRVLWSVSLSAAVHNYLARQVIGEGDGQHPVPPSRLTPRNKHPRSCLEVHQESPWMTILVRSLPPGDQYRTSANLAHLRSGACYRMLNAEHLPLSSSPFTRTTSRPLRPYLETTCPLTATNFQGQKDD
ncbi:hypothetical protein E2C01_008014 [Portunus trituberculatus]|uniref:Uncharacterized protein n=1 Tax=Portunus trituberculatus TaxID=210409 RepID=A0A5B7D170_PORTR|nr:hypothetical protein [Portunus trituberculatus]